MYGCIYASCAGSVLRLSSIRQRHTRRKHAVVAKAKDLRDALQRGALDPDPAFVEGGEFLRSIGMTNQAEISRVLDISMNPNSLFLSAIERKTSTASARRLSVDKDMRPVVNFFRRNGLSDSQIAKIISDIPYVLGYDIEKRIQPVLEYLTSVGVKDSVEIIANRPSLLGLDVDQNLKKIVGYLIYKGYDMEKIVELLETSI